MFFSMIVFLLVQVAPAQMPNFSPFSADFQIASTRGDNGSRDINGQVYAATGRIRVNMASAGHRSALITDLAAQTSDILLVDQQMYLEYKASEAPNRGQDTPAQDLKPYDPNQPCANRPDVTCKKIGVEEVSGRTCDHWELVDKQGKVVNLWIDEKLHFPVKVTTSDSTMLLTDIMEGEPDAGLFQIPANYEKLNIGHLKTNGKGRPPQK
jgi:hypothetical protein